MPSILTIGHFNLSLTAKISEYAFALSETAGQSRVHDGLQYYWRHDGMVAIKFVESHTCKKFSSNNFSS
jgi:hypothetical protein